MSFLGTCPQCSTEIPKDRYVSGFAICECGWSDTTGLRRANKAHDKKAVRSLVAGAVILVALFAHLSTWGSYSAAIPLVKIQQLTGTLSKAGYLELGENCIALGRFECAKSAYADLFSSNGDASGLALRANLEDRLGETAAATNDYAAYFSAGGKETKAFVAYGHLLETANRNAEASTAYENAIATTGEVLPVQATTGLVRLLMKEGKYELALERIKAFHESAGNAVGYLNTELTQLESYLGTQAKASAKPKSKSKKPAADTKKVARN
jgi:tetratricopeptide (TPR) repeat protein